jgi:twitching motility protein PilT
VVSQQLIPKAGGRGRALAIEVMVPNMAIRNLIREDKIHQIYGMMQAGQTKYGMQTMNQALFGLYQKRLISYDECVGRSSDPEELIQMIQRGSGGPVGAGAAQRR